MNGGKDGSGLEVPGVLVILALLGLYITEAAPLEGGRPKQALTAGVDLPQEEHIPARLWQDPWEAVELHRRSQRNTSRLPFEQRTGARSLGAVLKENGEERRVTVLVVTLPGAPYVEQQERRMRRRQAVLSALNLAGYSPRDQHHIGLLRVGGNDPEPPGPVLPFGPQNRTWHVGLRPAARTEAQAGGSPTLLPYEWMRGPPVAERTGTTKLVNVANAPQSEDGDGTDVLVLWVTDQQILPNPLAAVTDLARAVRDEHPLNPPRIRFVGPNSSDVLRAMLVETSEQLRKRERAVTAGAEPEAELELYAATATAEPTSLFQDIAGNRTCGDAWVRRALGARFLPDRPGPVASYLRQEGLELLRSIGDDRGLAQAALDELYQRGIRLRQGPHDDQPNDHVVLISEWDSFYGRALPQAFANAIVQAPAGTQAAPPPILHRFSYMRGLDGRLAGESDEAPGDQRDGAEQGELRSAAARWESEFPAGRARYDYLRRLSKRISQLDAQLRTGRAPNPAGGTYPKGRIRAIGILGSDVYDKLLIIQALRADFRSQVFFTTDLDARLFHPRYLPWTRNLVVVSNFGLELHPTLQGNIPAFRDNYQTAVFLATRLALEDESIEEKRAIGALLQPRIYEIGRDGPVDLSPEPAKLPDEYRPVTFGDLQVRSLSPPNTTFLLPTAGRQAAFVLFLLVLGAVLWRIMEWPQQSAARIGDAWRTERPALLAVALLMLVPIAAALTVPYLGTEPVLLDGTSTWPTTVLRALVAVAAIYLLIRIHDIDLNNLKAINRKYTLAAPADSAENGGDRLRLGDWLRARQHWCQAQHRPHGPDPESNHPPVCLTQLWRTYFDFEQPRRRAVRVTVLVLLSIALGIILVALFGRSEFPVRGETAASLDRLVLMFAVVAFVTLLFKVMDITLSCRRFVDCVRLSGFQCTTRRSSVSCGSGACGHLAQTGRAKAGAVRTAMKIVADRTGTVDTYVYYPLALLFVLIISRSRYFDNWTMPVALIIILTLYVGYMIYAIVSLRRAAIDTREAATEHLEEELERAHGAQEHHAEAELKATLEWTRGMREGAFNSVWHQPFIKGLLLPLGGLAWAGAEYMSLFS